MESDDEDIFAISDEEMPSPARVAPINPVEDHLLKHLVDVQNKIDVAANEIVETKETITRVLHALERQTLYGEDAISDSDSELYTLDGTPIIKKSKQSETKSSPDKVLEVVSYWQCALQDKWIIGVELNNKSCCTLLNPRYYPYVSPTRSEEIFGEATFWKLKEQRFFCSEKISSIHPGAVVATMVLDLPMFDQKSVVECWGIISYEIDEIQFQIPVPTIQLSVVKTIDSSYVKFLAENEKAAILVLKSTSTVEKIVKIQFSGDSRNDEGNANCSELFCFLTDKIFTRVRGNVYLGQEHGSLMYCLIEIQTIKADEANIRIFARSVSQLNIMLCLLQDKFPNVLVVEETDDCVEAAMAFIRELEMIRDKKSIREIQEAKVITDLLIP